MNAKKKSFTFSLSEFAIDVSQERYVSAVASSLYIIVLKVAVRFTGFQIDVVESCGLSQQLQITRKHLNIKEKLKYHRKGI